MNGKIFRSQYQFDRDEEAYLLREGEALKRAKYMMVRDLVDAIMADSEFGIITQHQDMITQIYTLEIAVMPLAGYKKLVKILEKADIIIFDEVTNTQTHLRDLI